MIYALSKSTVPSTSVFAWYIKLPNCVFSSLGAYTSLSKSPAVYYGSIESNNLVICGHSYTAHFGNLYKLKKEDIIIITDVNNNKYTYQVELTEILSPSNIKEMIESDFDLTIYTCTKDGLKRVTVRCNRI